MHGCEHTDRFARPVPTDDRHRAGPPPAIPPESWLSVPCWGTLVGMSARLSGGGIERWLSNLAGPELQQPLPGPAPGPQADGDVKCPICDKPRTDLVEEERYDEDFDYYWGNVRLPLWIALIWQVPWRQRLDIFVVGFIIGLIVAGVAVFWGLLLAQY